MCRVVSLYENRGSQLNTGNGIKREGLKKLDLTERGIGLC